MFCVIIILHTKGGLELSNEILNLILNSSKEGFIGINKTGHIKLYNNKAKEIFGIKSSGKVQHKSGYLKSGDIVIIADNMVGVDDGNLLPEDLESIGIYDNTIHRGDSLIAIGVYKNSNIEPNYRLLKSYNRKDSFSFHTYFQGIEIDVFMDFDRQRINIEVFGDNYYMDYHNSVGHLLVISARDHTIKFCQENGYTARKESLAELLRGKHFMAKGPGDPGLKTEDRFIFDIHEKNEIMEDFYNSAQGKECYFNNRYEEINGFPTYCSLLPIRSNTMGISALLKIEDVSQINQIIKEKKELSQVINVKNILTKNKYGNRKLLPEISGNSLAIQSSKRLAYLASQYEEPLLIHGEVGVGKSIFAKNIHKLSSYSSNTFVHFYCGDVAYNDLETSLFGDQNYNDIPGALGLSSGGTLYLDAIETLPLNIQKKLANAIRNQSYSPVNSETLLPLKSRIIASSSINLEEKVINGGFSEELYEVIQTLSIWIPPLSQRKDDIPFIVQDLSNEIFENYGMKPKIFKEDAIQILTSYPWKENTKSIKLFLNNLLLNSSSNCITVDILNHYLPSQIKSDENDMTLKEFLELKEKQFISSKLREYKGDKKRVMEALDISKTSLYDKINRYKI